MAKDRSKKRRAAKKAKQAAKKPASKTKSSGAGARAHPNELALAPGHYDGCQDERRDLDTARTPFAGKPKPRRFIRGYQLKNLPRSEDGWVPGEKKPSKCKRTYKELAERWLAERSKAERDQYKKDCVWAKWCPGMRPPNWWRLDLDDDAAYHVLCFCWRYNFRCYQPVMGLDFDEFLKKALKGDAVAKALKAIDKSCRKISEKAWLEENEKPEECDDSVYIERRLLRVDDAAMASTSTPSSRDNFIHAGPACGVKFAELDAKDVHFHHKALTVTGLGYFCRPCNQGVAGAYDRMGPVAAKAALKRAAVASTMKGVCIVLPLKKEK